MGRKSKLPQEPVRAHIESLTHEGRGIARIDGKTTFVDGALPGEQVMFRYTRRRRNLDEGQVVEILVPSEERVTPRCQHFGVCGGCSLQHLEPARQIGIKQDILLDDLARIGHVTPEQVLAPLTGPFWGYRRKARLGVKYVKKKGRVLVGFREKGSPYIADLQACEVLHPSVGKQLEALAHLVRELSCYDRLPQIEVAVGDTVTALVFRHLEELTAADRQTLVQFAQQQDFHIYLQPAGPDSVEPLWPESSVLSYRLENFGVEIQFLPTDFTQVNSEINRQMLEQALALLALDSGDSVLDLFCGVGNFSLPLARRVAQVVGVEGEAGLIERARHNALTNQCGNASFYLADLAVDQNGAPWQREYSYSKALLDPPRSGAEGVLPYLGKLQLSHIVYVSCNPATLARDADTLVNQYGYRLECAGVMDMFPHTAHVESIALFRR